MSKSALLYLAISFGVVLPCLAQGLGTDNTRTENDRFKRTDPLFDITAYGARSVGVSGFSTTASCNGTKAITLGSASSFQNGDGITIGGCGAPNAMSTPGAPTAVTPSIASGGTTTGIVINSPTGSSTYSYKIVARDKYGALTAAGSATTIKTGQALLGLQTAKITTESLSSDFITVNTLASTVLIAGALVHITGASDPDFDGWFIVHTVNSGTQFVIANAPIDSRGIGWQFGDSASSSGGNIAFYLSNHIKWAAVKGAWEYYIYGGPGITTFNLIGQTKPSADTWVDTSFDDYGATYMAGQTFPSYVPSTAPSSATKDPLTTTIVSGAGTKYIVVANAASQTASEQTAQFDDGPAILAAANAAHTAGGTLNIPPGPGNFYPINSFLRLPAGLNIKQSGALSLYETVEVQQNTNWFGDWSNDGEPQFGFVGTSGVYVYAANPGIYTVGSGIDTAYMSFFSEGTNGGTIEVVQDSVNAEWDYVNFVANNGGSSDYLSTNIVFRSTSTGGNNYHFRKTLFSGGPNQVADKSWTPLVYFPPNQNGAGSLLNNQDYVFRCMECFFNRRGIEEELSAGIAGRFEFDGGYRQGGITPFMMVGNSLGNIGGSFIFHNLLQDTEAVGTLALLGNGGSFQVTVDSDYLSNYSADTNGIPPPFTGYRVTGVRSFGSITGNIPNRNTELSISSCTVTYPYSITGPNLCINDPMKKMFETMDFPAKHSLFWDLATPSAVTASAATNGGSLTANTTYYYSVSAIGPDGGETVPATVASSSTTTSSNLTIPVSWRGITGAVRYNVYRCTSRCVFSDGRIQNSGNWRLVDRVVTTTRINDNGLGVGQGPPTATGTGSVGANATEVYAPAFVTVSPLSNGKSYTATDTAPITANRTYSKPDQSGTYALDLTGSTSVINGTLLSATCDSGTASVTGAVIGMPVVVSTTDGSDLGGAFNIRASVTSNGTVTVYVCGVGKPPSKGYNVRVIQ
jgi:hypothetical protein